MLIHVVTEFASYSLAHCPHIAVVPGFLTRRTVQVISSTPTYNITQPYTSRQTLLALTKTWCHAVIQICTDQRDRNVLVLWGGSKGVILPDRSWPNSNGGNVARQDKLAQQPLIGGELCFYSCFLLCFVDAVLLIPLWVVDRKSVVILV